MYLTGREIKGLAEYAGFSIEPLDTMGEDILEQEFNVSDCPKNGVQDDDGVVHHYDHVVTCDGCDGNECMPLGLATTDT